MNAYYRIPDKEGNDKEIDLLENVDTLVYVRAATKSDANLQFLTKILASVGKEAHNYSLHTELDQPKIAHLIQAASAKKILLFGVSPQECGLHIRVGMYGTQSYQNLTILRADSLESLKEDAVAKKALWQELKTIYQK